MGKAEVFRLREFFFFLLLAQLFVSKKKNTYSQNQKETAAEEELGKCNTHRAYRRQNGHWWVAGHLPDKFS